MKSIISQQRRRTLYYSPGKRTPDEEGFKDKRVEGRTGVKRDVIVVPPNEIDFMDIS